LGRIVGRRASTVVSLFVLTFLAIAVAYPAASMIRRFADEEILLSAGGTARIIGFTVFQAVLSTLLTLIAALPLAHVLATYRVRLRSTVMAAVLVPFVLPTVVVAVAVRGLLGRFGLAVDGIEGSLVAILIAHVVFNVSVVVRMVGGYWALLDQRMMEAAAVLGASPRRRFRRVTLPLLRPALLAASAIVFLFTFTSFGVIVILGGLSRATVETEIYRFAITRNDFGSAAVLAFIQAVAVAGVAILNQRLQQRIHTPGSGAMLIHRREIASVRERLYVGAVVAATLGLLLLPFLTLVARSVDVDGSFGLDHFAALAERPNVLPVSPLRSLGNSLLFATAAAVLAGTVGSLAAIGVGTGFRLSRWVETAVLVPLGISAVTLGFGYLVGFTFLELRRSPVLVIVAHSVIGIPFVVGSVLPAVRSLDSALLDAGSALGASSRRVIRRVLVPLLRPSVTAGMGFAGAVSLGEFGASGFLARGRSSYTAPQAIFGLIGQPAAVLQGQAAALCVLLGCVIVCLVIVIDRLRGSPVGSWL
jgi:thiamine transport system permease protein